MSEVETQGCNACPKKKEAETEEKRIEYPYIVSVKFYNSTRAYTFGTFLSDLKKGEQVVVETSQGVELGDCTTNSLSKEENANPDLKLAPVLRRAGKEDVENFELNFKYAHDAFVICNEEIHNLGLEMHLLSADYLLDRSKVLFVYQSETRVDFRELLKALGARLHCRIELRQVGERDKAKMVGGIGMCGMELCCSRFKTHMDVISINMAKTQLLALNTEKLSGMCGKLMCCLKYENDNYKELTEGLPKLGAHIEFEGNIYRVTSMNVMTNEARLENADSFQVITCDELKEKAIIRKGVAIARHSAHKGPKQNLSKDAARAIPGVKHTNVTGGPDTSMTKFKISDASKDYQESELKPHKAEVRKFTKKTTDNTAAAKPQAKSSHHTNNRHTQSQRKPMDTKNNPNVTVRSFRSKKTAGEEK